MKQNVMYELLKVKLSQCAAFQRSLAASKGKMLTENTTHNYWGRGRSGEGLNMLGRLLMTLRDSEAESAQSRNMSILQQGWSNQYHHSNSRLPAYHDHVGDSKIVRNLVLAVMSSAGTVGNRITLLKLVATANLSSVSSVEPMDIKVSTAHIRSLAMKTVPLQSRKKLRLCPCTILHLTCCIPLKVMKQL
jgi:hypothetical protein